MRSVLCQCFGLCWVLLNRIWSTFVNIPYAVKKNIYSLVVLGYICKFIILLLLILIFKSSISSIHLISKFSERGVSNFLIRIVYFSISLGNLFPHIFVYVFSRYGVRCLQLQDYDISGNYFCVYGMLLLFPVMLLKMLKTLLFWC